MDRRTIIDPNKVDNNFFSNDSEESFYWAGFIAADGCVRITNTKYSTIYSLEINLSSKDHQHLVKFRNDIKLKTDVRIRKTGKRITGEDLYISRLKLFSKKIINDLYSKFNIQSRKTHTLEFPNYLKNNKLIRHFMRGYFDGDGGFYLNKNKSPFQMSARICGTINFLTDFKSVLEENCGFISSSKPYMYNGQGALNYFGNGQLSKISNYLYNDSKIYLERKFIQAKLSQSIAVSRKTITPDDIITTYRDLKSTYRVGNELKVSQATIINLIKKYNLHFLYEEK